MIGNYRKSTNFYKELCLTRGMAELANPASWLLAESRHRRDSDRSALPSGLKKERSALPSGQFCPAVFQVMQSCGQRK